jgi:hypothetical protein
MSFHIHGAVDGSRGEHASRICARMLAIADDLRLATVDRT